MDIFGCKSCKGEGEISGDLVKTCSEPLCSPGFFFADDWICKPIPKADSLDYFVSQSFSDVDLQDSDIAIEITFQTSEGKTLEAGFIQY